MHKRGNLRVKKHCGAFAEYFWIQLYPNSLIQFHPRGILWRFTVAGNNKLAYWSLSKFLYILWPVLFQIWDSITGFYKRFRYKILRKYGQNDPRWYKCKHMRTWRRLKMFFASMQRRSQTCYILINNSKVNQGKRDAVFVTYVSINAYTLVMGNWRKQFIWKTLK